jgi:hypothetical protein
MGSCQIIDEILHEDLGVYTILASEGIMHHTMIQASNVRYSLHALHLNLQFACKLTI